MGFVCCWHQLGTKALWLGTAGTLHLCSPTPVYLTHPSLLPLTEGFHGITIITPPVHQHLPRIKRALLN